MLWIGCPYGPLALERLMKQPDDPGEDLKHADIPVRWAFGLSLGAVILFWIGFVIGEALCHASY
jgi:hypothetical protein